MDLFPTIDVTLAKKKKAVWAVCKLYGYEEHHGGDWDDNAAMLAFYDARLVDWLKGVYADELRKDYLSEFVPGTFDE